jgi:hypothetical protein
MFDVCLVLSVNDECQILDVVVAELSNQSSVHTASDEKGNIKLFS